MTLLTKKAQVTLFILVGIVLISIIAFLFITYKPELNIFRKIKSPVEFLTSCMEESIETSEKEFFQSKNLLQETTLNYKYAGQTMPFLCYSTEFYYPCIPQSPLFSESIRRKMENKLSRDISQCILTLKEDYEKRGYTFDYSSFNVSLIFEESQVTYQAEIPISITKGEESIKVSTTSGAILSPLPALLRTAETIVNYESVFCEFNYMTWQAVNRAVSINRFRGGDQTKVYTLKDRNSEKEIKFAIRTCVLPAGI